jgi:hypothetical protein
MDFWLQSDQLTAGMRVVWITLEYSGCSNPSSHNLALKIMLRGIILDHDGSPSIPWIIWNLLAAVVIMLSRCVLARCSKACRQTIIT